MAKKTLKATGTLEDKINAVFLLKEDVKKMNEQIDAIMAGLETEVDNNIILTEKGKVFFVEGNTYLKLNKDKLLNYLETTLKIPQDVINEVMKNSSTQTILKPYLKAVKSK